MKKLTLIFVTLAALSGCGIDTSEPVVNLNPPLGLSYEFNSNVNPWSVRYKFYALNPETYLTGYNIYVGLTQELLKSGQCFRLQNPNSTDTNDPTTNWGSFTEAREFTFESTQLSNNEPYAGGVEYFVFVKAWASSIPKLSSPSGWIQFTYPSN